MATKTHLLRKVRLFCSECMGGPKASEEVWPVPNSKDIAECPVDQCVWHGYRFGKDPDPSHKGNPDIKKFGFQAKQINE